MHINIKENKKGILLVLLISIFSLILSNYFLFLNSITLGLLLGIVIGNLYTFSKSYNSGISLTGLKMLEYSIVFLAFGVNYTHIYKLGINRFFALLLFVIIILILTIYFSKKLKNLQSIGWLIGFGTAICGSSAIAALAPTLNKNKEDVGVSMAVVNFYCTIGMLLLPIILVRFNFSNLDISLIIGGTLHSVGNVAGAGFAMSNEIGENALTIKLARVALLSPALLFFNYLINRETKSSIKSFFKFPWYLLLFIFITIFVSIVPIQVEFLKTMEYVGKLVLTIAMVAIGLNISIKTLITSGKKGLLFGLIMFLIYITLFLLFIVLSK